MRKFEKSILALAFVVSPAAFGANGNIMLQNLMPSESVFSSWQKPLYRSTVSPQILSVSDAYWTNVGEDQVYTHATRHLDGIKWKAGQGSEQSVKFPTNPLKVVNRMMATVFWAKPGDEITATFDYAFRKQDGAWMNGYVYIDRNNDGQFDQQLGSEVMAYSHLGGKDSKDNPSDGSQVNPPTFILPSDMAPGIYRVRYKVDWDNIDPAGNTTEANHIVKNGGAICDALLNIHGDKCTVKVLNPNNELQAEDGSALLAEYNFGTALKVKVNAVEGKIFRGIRVRHGYHLDAAQLDKNGNPQYQVTTFSADQLKKNSYTIPASCMDGEVELEALFADAQGDYFTNVLEGQDYNNENNRYLSGISLNSGDGNQSFDIPTPLKVYTKLLDRSFKAKAGEELTAAFDFSTSWMNGYVYIDRNNDGKFDQNLGSEVMAYSHLGGKDSKGNNTNGGQVNPPSFTLPSDLKPGIYRMRYKVDWDNIDPAGNISEGNDIIKNGGAICDVLLNVHTDECKITAVPDKNGEVKAADGQALTKAAFGQALKVQVVVAPGFVCKSLKVRHGYQLTGAQLDAHGNPQYQEEVVPGYLIKNGEVTLPAEYMDGDVQITPVVAQAATPAGGDYALNFDKATQRGDAGRTLKRVTFTAQQGGTSVVTVPAEAKTVYQDLMTNKVSAAAGDLVRVNTDFVGSGVHYYLYVDLNEDGQLLPDLAADGQPTAGSELLSYTYLNGKNSKGEAVELSAVDMKGLPTFQLPEGLPEGNYRARLKVDVDNVDAGGSEAIAAQGGYVVDFLLNVNNGATDLKLHTLNGNIYGAKGAEALPMTVAPGSGDLTLVPTPVAAGYVAKEMTIKMGHRFDGPEVDARGNRQWSLLTVPGNMAYTLAQNQIFGDVEVTANFEKSAEAAYDLVFSDEFNGPDGSQPDATKWQRSIRYNATWNRWVSKSNDVVFLRDGNLVTRAIKNPQKTDEDPGDMITGAVESRDLFTWARGKVECRAKANLFNGTFPAIWMMPENQSKGWPNDGEIDIFETVNNENKAYHTLHTQWTYADHNGGQGGTAQNISHDRYHTYGLEWDPAELRFFVDGKLTYTYKKSTDQNQLNQGQWPFNNNFYLILNQSVGKGNGWAKEPDYNHVYEFLVDWVRVYQTPVNRSKCDLQTVIYQTMSGCQEGTDVNQYTINHQVLDEANQLFEASEDVAALKKATEEVKKGVATLNMPALNHFYRVRCAEQTGKGNDMKYLQSTQTNGKQNMISGVDGKGVEATFLYTADGLLSYTQGLYCGAESLLAADQKAQAVFSEAQNGRRGQYNIKLGDQFIYGSDATLKGGQPDAKNGYNWWLEPVNELQVNFKGNETSGFYATLYSPMNLTLPEGVKAYVGQKKNDALVLTEVQGVPANQGVLLIAQTEGVKVFSKMNSTIEMPAENDLVGQYATVNKPEGEEFYGLGYGTAAANADKVGFYLMDNLSTLKGFRARVKKDAANAANELKMTFGDATGIETLEEVLTGKAQFFNLSGRRVVAPEKGIYIVNGKKVYIK